MTRFQLILAVITTLGITIASGAMHGRFSGRWGGSEEALEAATAVESLPAEFGSWKLEESKPLGKSELEQLQPFGYVNGFYVDQNTQEKISVFVLVGPVGPTAVHTPEICYSSALYTAIQPKEPTVLQADGPSEDKFWAMTFQANTLDGTFLRVYYGWSDGTRWEASEGGRYKFAGLPFLYKIQVASFLSNPADLREDEACRRFLTDFLPVLSTYMRPSKMQSVW